MSGENSCTKKKSAFCSRQRVPAPKKKALFLSPESSRYHQRTLASQKEAHFCHARTLAPKKERISRPRELSLSSENSRTKKMRAISICENSRRTARTLAKEKGTHFYHARTLANKKERIFPARELSPDSRELFHRKKRLYFPARARPIRQNALDNSGGEDDFPERERNFLRRESDFLWRERDFFQQERLNFLRDVSRRSRGKRKRKRRIIFGRGEFIRRRTEFYLPCRAAAR